MEMFMSYVKALLLGSLIMYTEDSFFFGGGGLKREATIVQAL